MRRDNKKDIESWETEFNAHQSRTFAAYKVWVGFLQRYFICRSSEPRHCLVLSEDREHLWIARWWTETGRLRKVFREFVRRKLRAVEHRSRLDPEGDGFASPASTPEVHRCISQRPPTASSRSCDLNADFLYLLLYLMVDLVQVL